MILTPARSCDCWLRVRATCPGPTDTRTRPRRARLGLVTTTPLIGRATRRTARPPLGDDARGRSRAGVAGAGTEALRHAVGRRVETPPRAGPERGRRPR